MCDVDSGVRPGAAATRWTPAGTDWREWRLTQAWPTVQVEYDAARLPDPAAMVSTLEAAGFGGAVQSAEPLAPPTQLAR